jgi:uncharacterized protein YecE (DUF72 family)
MARSAIHYLRKRGLSQQEIAEQVGCERRTVARRITAAAPPRKRGRDVYVYFDNDYEANAPNDALRLATLLRAHSAMPP